MEDKLMVLLYEWCIGVSLWARKGIFQEVEDEEEDSLEEEEEEEGDDPTQGQGHVLDRIVVG
jgi:hypothetical protein